MSASKKVYLFANWKMYLDYDESNILANALVSASGNFAKKIKMVVFPSALSFYPVAQVLGDAGVGSGAQNLYFEDKGGFTGENSAVMYKNAGAKYALVGHSERRHLFHETNHDVRQKMETILSVGLIPVLCVGETDKERKDGKAKDAVEIQLRAALDRLKWKPKSKLIIAYEPVWAVGTGNHCDPIEAEKMCAMIFKMASNLAKDTEVVVLYGGSVSGDNIKDFMKQPNISGVLVGGASAKLDSWLKIVQNAS
ncbi:MAG: triose-phosphate isomerase [Candidatus Magasanikbacteria bacterium]